MNTQARSSSRRLWPQLLAVLLLLLFSPQALHAQEPALTFQTDRLRLQGTPGATLYFPVDLQAGPAGAQAVTLSLETLGDPDRPTAIAPGDQVAFQPTVFNLAPHAARRVWGTIETLPTVPGVYSGRLVADSEDGQVDLPVELQVRFAVVQLAAPAGGAVTVQGQSGNLAEVLRLEAVAGPASDITLAADKLPQVDGPGAILPAQLSLTPETLSLETGESRPVTLTVSDDVLPGTYQGRVRFVQAGQSLADVPAVVLTVEVLAEPELNLPLGDTITADLVRCTNPLGCGLARLLLPADYRQDGLTLQVENNSLAPVVVSDLQTSLARIGAANISGASGLLQPPPTPLTIPPRSTQDLFLTVPATRAQPGRYQGQVTLHLATESGQPAPQTGPAVKVELNIRRGPLLAIILVVAGVLAGRVLQHLSSEQNQLLLQYYRVRGRLAPFREELTEADWDRVESDALALRQRIYAQDLENMAQVLDALAERPERLRTLDRGQDTVTAACQKHNLIPDDCALLAESAARLRGRIHDGQLVDVAAAVKAIAARAEPLGRLRDLEGGLSGVALSPSERTRLTETIAAARAALGKGDDQAAETHYNHVRQVLDLLPDVERLQADGEQQLQNQPDQLSLLTLTLQLARQALFSFEFERARRWLEQARFALAAWQPASGSGAGTGGMRMGGRQPWSSQGSGQLGQAVDALLGRIGGWQPLAFLGDQAAFVIERPATQRGPGLREQLAAWWGDFAPAAWSEISLWVATPLIWLVTMLLTALIGFQALYLSQGATFGADPLQDYLPLLLWGLTSDVTGATLSKLAGLRQGRGD